MTDRTGQNAIQCLSVGGVRETSPSTSASVKFNSSYGINDTQPISGQSTLTNDGIDRPATIAEIGPMGNVGFYNLHAYWGALETARNVYSFEQPGNLIDTIMGLCVNAGKRLVITLMTSVNSTGSVDFNINAGRFPAYLRDDYPSAPGRSGGGLMASAEAPGPGIPGRVDARLHLPEIRDRYLALHQALSTHLNGHAKFEAASTYDSTPSTIIKIDPTFNQPDYQDNLKVMMQQLKIIWPNTNVWFALDSGVGTVTSQVQSLLDVAADNRMVITGPDVALIEFFTGGDGGTIFQRTYQGLNGGHDYRPEMCWAPKHATGNLGPPRVPPAASLSPTLLMQNLALPTYKNALNARWMSIPRKTNGVGGTIKDNDQFWLTAAPTFTLNNPTLKAWLNQSFATIGLSAATPPNYPGVVVGG